MFFFDYQVCATLGTTSCTSIDNLVEIGKVCELLINLNLISYKNL